MAYQNQLSQEMASLQHFSEQQLGENSSVLRTILPQQLGGQSSPTGKPAESQQQQAPPPPTWLNSAILRQQSQYVGDGSGGSGEGNFLNSHSNSESSAAAAAASQASNQWLSRSILQRNVRDDVPVSRDSMIAAAIMHESAADLNANDDDDVKNIGNNDNHGGAAGGELGESEVVGGGTGIVNWQNARYKAEILAHPLYEQLLSAHVACLRIATPVDQLPRIDAQLAQSQQVIAKYSALGHGNLGDDRELDQFLVNTTP